MRLFTSRSKARSHFSSYDWTRNIAAWLVTYEKGKPKIYAELKKALYSTLQATAVLEGALLIPQCTQVQGEPIHTTQPCVMNKHISNGHQCTIGWKIKLDIQILPAVWSMAETKPQPGLQQERSTSGWKANPTQPTPIFFLSNNLAAIQFL